MVRVGFFLVAALAAAWSAAQTVTLRETVVITANGDEVPLGEVSCATTVLEGDELEAHGGPLVHELLRRVPGATVVRSGLDGGVTSLFVRGAGSNQTLVLLDGVRLNSGYFGGYDWSLPLTAGLQRVEVVRGPATLLYGNNALGGVVNVVAPALAQADVAIAMNTGTQAAREAANMVDLDSSPTKLIQVVEIGKQMLMTRGALTTFSLANDVAKYFAIIPAAFAGTYPQLGLLNVMQLASPASALLSAVIFNALIIVVLIPLALKGVRYRALGAEALLRRNLLVYGLGGLLLPFAGIKLIDMLLALLGLV